MGGFGMAIPLVLLGVVLLLSGLKILREYERVVIFRLGRLVASRGPGVIYVIPFVECIMPTMEKFILDSDERGGVLPLLLLKGMVSSPIPATLQKAPIPNGNKR